MKNLINVTKNILNKVLPLPYVPFSNARVAQKTSYDYFLSSPNSSQFFGENPLRPIYFTNIFLEVLITTFVRILFSK